MPLMTMLEKERYGQLTEDEQKLYDELGEELGEKFELSKGIITEELEYLEELADSYVEDLEADIIGGLGTRYSPLELFEDKDLKKRYEQAIENFEKLSEKLAKLTETIEEMELEK